MTGDGHATRTRDRKRSQKRARNAQSSYSSIDPASKRLFILSLFVLLESWKIYDAIALKSTKINVDITSLNKFTFVIKYFLLEGIFFWTLPLVQVPQLTFSPITTFVITAVLNIATFFLVSSSSLTLIGGVIFLALDFIRQSSELTLGGDTVRPDTAISMDSYFKGRYTIHYVPDSTAFFNPFGKKDFCLLDSSAIGVPVQFNTTSKLGWLQLQHTSPENEVMFYNFTQNDISKLLKRDQTHLSLEPGFVSGDSRVFYLELPVRQPGQYSLKEVRDVDGLKIRTYKSDLAISSCPSAKVVTSPDDSRHICISGSELQSNSFKLPKVDVFGAAPLEVEFSVSQKKTLKVMKRAIGSSMDLRPVHFTEDLFRETIVDQNIKFSNGPLELRILLVTDGLKINRKYNPQSDASDLLAQVQLRTMPNLRLFDSDTNAKLLVNGTKRLKFQLGRDSIGEGEWPLRVEIKYQSTLGIAMDTFTKHFKNYQEMSRGIEVSKPGFYKIQSGSSKFCDCNIYDEFVNIEQVSPPSIDISAEPIVDKCIGMTGYSFKFNARGQAPFQVQYQVFQNRTDGMLRPVYDSYGNVRRTLHSLDAAFEFEYKPPGEGNYVVVFKGLKDANYQKEGVSLDEARHTYLTYFRQRSRLSLGDYKSLTGLPMCLGSLATLPVLLSGNFPFLISYEIRGEAGKALERKTVNNITTSQFEIQSPKFEQGGNYRVQLLEVKDSLGCTANLQGDTFKPLVVRKDIPEVSLGIEMEKWNISIIEGDSLKLPLNVKSTVGKSDRDRLVYSITSLTNSSDTQLRTAIGIENLRLKEAGRYKLVSYSGGGCDGTVRSPEKEIRVEYIPRPSLILRSPNCDSQEITANNFQLHSVCKGGRRNVDMHLVGKAPFIVDYRIKDPSGKTDARTMTVHNEHLTINLPTTQQGTYQHVFLAVYDSLYTQEKTARLNLPDLDHKLQYDVLALPKVSIASGSDYLQFCESTLSRVYRLPPKIQLEIEGSYPVTLEATLVKGESKAAEKFILKDLVSPEVDLSAVISKRSGKALTEILQIGEYFILLDKITDSNGCSSQIKDTNVIVLVTEVPKMTKEQGKDYYCVGDHISYNLNGIAPFTVFYDFNGKQRKAKLDNYFRRLASKPGNLTVTALLDSSIDNCLVNFTDTPSALKSLQARVYDLPSVEVNQGDYIVRNIHEGDQTEIKFSFTGVPPFSFTYVRMLDTNEKQNEKKHAARIVETKTIEGIWDYDYVVMASLEGTYEATEVKDAYCRAKKDGFAA